MSDEDQKPMTPAHRETVFYLMEEFLRDQKELRRRNITLETVAEQVRELRTEVKTISSDHGTLTNRLNRYRDRLKTVESKVLSPDQRRASIPDEDTGSHDVRQVIENADLKRQLAEERKRNEERENEEKEKEKSIAWYKRQSFLLFSAIFVAGCSATATGCSGYLVWRYTQGQGQIKTGTP